jgi:membrane protein
MTQIEQPLYPKVSSIYNKIMQLAIAIFIIIILMNLWLFSNERNQQTIDQHFNDIAQQYLKQTVSGVSTLLLDDKEKIQSYIDELTANEWLKDISLYDKTGQLIFASSNQISINDLYGRSDFKADRSEKFIPFVVELRDDEVKGYVRITIEKKQLIADLELSAKQNFDLFRLMLILAGVVGFLLTRGLNRFSRQGYRVRKK